MGFWKKIKELFVGKEEDISYPLISEEEHEHQMQAQKEADEIAWTLEDEGGYDFSQDDEFDFDFTPDEDIEQNQNSALKR